MERSVHCYGLKGGVKMKLNDFVIPAILQSELFRQWATNTVLLHTQA